MRLAMRLGRTLAELMETMSSTEFSLWAEAYKRDEWGDAPRRKHAELVGGVVACTVANYAGKERAAGAGMAQPADFLLTREVEDEPAEPDPVAYFTAVANSESFNKKP